MTPAFLDTSVLVALAFNEPAAADAAQRLSESPWMFAATLLDAELRCVMQREGRTLNPALLDQLHWVIPGRRLTEEIDRVLSAGYVRGADCWHLATALYLSPNPSELVFLTLDGRQRDVAVALGFRV